MRRTIQYGIDEDTGLVYIDYIKWTRKVSLNIKNIHRVFWGMKQLEE